MNNIIKFNGIRFNSRKVEISECLAPPYDVFDYGDVMDKNLRKNPCNIVHIQKPLGDGDSKYTEARKILEDFLNSQILITEEKEGVYILNQQWDGSSRTGIIAAVRLDETYSRIRPHEKTKPGPILDRFKLTKEAGLSIGCIFVVFDDKDKSVINAVRNEIKNKQPEYDITFPGSIKNKLYFTEGSSITGLLENKTLYIADGHHRYRTMLDFRNYMREQKAENNFDYTMMFLVPDTEVTILPYHRLIKNLDQNLVNSLLENLAQEFEITKNNSTITQPPAGAVGLYIKENYFYLTPKEDYSELLDVEILHQKILEPYLKLDYDKVKGGEFVHFKSGDEDISEIKILVDSGKYQMSFILNPPSFEDIKKISDGGKTMPPKSTYFYPKVPSGIVMYRLF